MGGVELARPAVVVFAPAEDGKEEDKGEAGDKDDVDD